MLIFGIDDLDLLSIIVPGALAVFGLAVFSAGGPPITLGIAIVLFFAIRRAKKFRDERRAVRGVVAK